MSSNDRGFIKGLIFFGLLLFFNNILAIQNNTSKIDTTKSKKNIKLRDYQRSGEFYPYAKLTKKDSIEWPLLFELKIDIYKIKNFELGKNTFNSEFGFTTYNNHPSKYAYEVVDRDKKNIEDKDDKYDENALKWIQPSNGEVWDMEHSSYVQMALDTELDLEIGYANTIIIDSIKNNNRELFYGDMVNLESRYSNSAHRMNWDYSKFPFDKQKITLKALSYNDSSLVSFKHSKLPSTFQDSLFLKNTGYKVKVITKEYYQTIETELINTAPEITRKTVVQGIVIDYILERSFSDQVILFFKIFIAGILSYLIATLAFLFDTKELESRVNLLVGGIFGVIGNKYYSDSIMPVNNVSITTIDLVNILILFMLMFNVFILLIQQKAILTTYFSGKSIVHNGRFGFWLSILVFSFLLIILIKY